MSSLRTPPKTKVGRLPPESALGAMAQSMAPGHRVIWLLEPERAWQELLRCIACAQKCIDIQLYMLSADAVGQQFLAALTAARRRGVAVRLMLDGIGSLELPYQALAEFLEVGGEFRLFGPIWLRAPWRHWKKRNHRKVFIFDGNSAIVTGRNVGEHYYPSPQVTEAESGEIWQDLGALIQGPTVASLAATLQRDWADRLRRTGRLVRLRQTFAEVFGSPIVRAEARSLTSTRGAQLKQDPSATVANGPRLKALFNLGHRRSAHANRGYLKAIRAATQSIWLAHSYFLPERALQRALVAAARRGVRVVVLLPDIAVTDVRAVGLASIHGLPPLLRAGIEVYMLGGPMLHAKAGVIDGQWWTMGSANLDPLSRQRNLEANLAGADIRDASQILSQFARWRDRATRWTLAHHRRQPWLQRALGWFLWKFRLIL